MGVVLFRLFVPELGACLSWECTTLFFQDPESGSDAKCMKFQVEMHPLWRQEKLREYCRQKGIVITAYSPLGAPNSIYGINDVITNSTINEIAQRKKKTPAQVRSNLSRFFHYHVNYESTVNWHLIHSVPDSQG